MRPFTADDAEDFFGRERLVHELVNDVTILLAAETGSGRCLTIIGPSGSGKSSVVMAGLLSQLHRGALPGSDTWLYLEPMVPGKRPLQALTRILKPYFPNSSFKTLREDLEDDAAQGLHLLTTQLVKERGSSRIVLLVDQFEEVFTQTETEDERQRFIDLLLTATTEPSGPLLVLLTLRADFYDRPMHYPRLSRLIQKHQRQVLPMDVEDLRATIEQPAVLPDVQLSFEGNLVGDLLFEMQGQVGALPLLQFTLDQLFERRDGRCLTLQAYHEIGGVKGALSQHAEKTYGALPSDEHRRLARTLFLRLMEVGDSEQETARRRAARSEFTSHDATQNCLMRETIDAFIAARLLTANEIAGTTTLEVSHEAVLREWKRLHDWLREAHDDIRFQQALRKDVAEWVRRRKPRDRLYRGAQLKEAQVWARRNTPSEQEQAFLQASAVRRTLSVMSLIVIVPLLVYSIGFVGGSFVLRTFVITLLDNWPGSLRWSIANASSGSTITFAPYLKGTIELTGGSLEVTGGKQLNIVGPGARQLTITGGNRNAFIRVSKGATVNISGLSFKNSQTFNSAFLSNEGTMAITNSIISNNMTTSGVMANGGGIYNNGTGTLTVINSLLSNNVVSGNSSLGGGIDNDGKLTVVHSTFLKNIARGGKGSTGYGGGINNNITGNTIIESSTFSENLAGGDQSSQGGGIDNDGKLTVVNSTFLKNRVLGSIGSTGSGGGIANTSRAAAIRFSTLYNNTSGAGGGIWTDPIKSGLVTISDSIIAENSAPNSPDISGAQISEGYNLTENVTGVNGRSSTDRQVTLADLKVDLTHPYNNGSTPTLRLQQGSPAFDAIPGNLCSIAITNVFGHAEKIATDQLGHPRLHKAKNACDIGAT